MHHSYMAIFSSLQVEYSHPPDARLVVTNHADKLLPLSTANSIMNGALVIGKPPKEGV